MNKKLVISSVLGLTLLLTSCATKPLGTFDEEIKAEQANYIANINKYFENMDEFMEGKFEQKGDFKITAEADKQLKGELSGTMNSKSIIENNNILVDYALTLNGDVKIDKSATDESLANNAGNELSGKIDLKLGFDGKNLYANVKNLDFDGKGTEEIKNDVKNFKTQYDAMIKPYTNKWYFFDLSTLPDFENMKAEFEKAISMSKKSINMIKDTATLLVSGDIFKNTEKTTYDGKEAYKFEIDEAKFKNHILSVYKNITEKYSDVLVAQGATKEQIDEFYKDFESFLNEKTLIKESEAYLFRGSDGTANIIVKKLEIYQNDTDYVNVDISILEKDLKFVISDSQKEGELSINFSADKSGKISYNGLFKGQNQILEGDHTVSNTHKLSDFFKFSGDFKNSKSGKTLNEQINLNIEFLKSDLLIGSPFENGAKIKLNLNQSATKNDSVVITKETITENSTEVVSINDLIQSFGAGFPMMPVAPQPSIDSENIPFQPGIEISTGTVN